VVPSGVDSRHRHCAARFVHEVSLPPDIPTAYAEVRVRSVTAGSHSAVLGGGASTRCARYGQTQPGCIWDTLHIATPLHIEQRMLLPFG